MLTVVLAILAIAFALPAARSKPHDVPIGAAGPMAAGSGPGTPPLGRGVADILEQHAPGAFTVTYYPGEAALRDAIRNRDVYGGISFGAGPNVAGQAAPEGRTLLIATGGSPMVAQMLTQIGNGICPADRPVRCTPRTSPRRPPTTRAAPAWPRRRCRSPWPACCPRSRSCLLLKREVWTRFTAAVVFAAVAGTGIAALLRYVFGSIDQNIWGVAAGLTLGLLAAGLSMLGLGSLFGRFGLAIGALLALLLGNPLSGLSSAPEMLPTGWGTLGQWLPQGANATLLRSTAFFDGAGATTAIAVLTCWAIAGAALIVIAAVRQGRSAPA